MIILRLYNLKTNSIDQVAWADSLAQAIAFVDSQRSVVPWSDGIVEQVFKPESILLDYAEPNHSANIEMGIPSYEDVGTLQDWIGETVKNWENAREKIPEATIGD